MKISVCIITYKRPLGLTSVLAGIKAQNFSNIHEPEIEIIVVDNDEHGESEAISSKFAKEMKWPLVFTTEPRRGIPFARNTAIAYVNPNRDYIAFIDDDEVPEPQWLEELIIMQQKTNADVIMGPVVPIYSNDIPQWFIDGNFHLYNLITNYKDGEVIKYASTNNVLIRYKMIVNFNLKFNEEMALTGGTDTLFFMTAKKYSTKFVWANNAIVTETVPASRANLKWLLLRAFRLGNTLSICNLHLDNSIKAITIRIIKGVWRLVLGLIVLLTVLVKGRIGLINALQNFSRGFGTLAGVFNIRYNEYKNVHGQ